MPAPWGARPGERRTRTREAPRPLAPARDQPKRSRSRFPPAAPVAREQIMGLFRAPGAGRVRWRWGVSVCRPGAHDAIDVGPLLLDLVATCEERRVAAHRVEQEPLVRLGGVRAERGAVTEIHGDVAPDRLLPPLLRDIP